MASQFAMETANTEVAGRQHPLDWRPLAVEFIMNRDLVTRTLIG